MRDLLGVEVDVADLLPADDSSYGFDNIAGVLKMSPALVERYLAAARVISRSAVGSPPASASASIYRVSPETQQHDRDVRLPLGTRGGTLVRHVFPVDAEYEIKVDLGGGPGGAAGDRHQLEITIDGVPVNAGAVGREGPAVRVPVTAGPHDVGVTFFRVPPDLVEQVREPFENPAAPSGTGGITGRLPSISTRDDRRSARRERVRATRRAAAGCSAARRQMPSQEAACARTILTPLARRAYRGLSTREQVDELMTFFEAGKSEHGKFDDGIELALRRLLVSPEFLYRIEGGDPRRASPLSAGAASGRPERCSPPDRSANSSWRRGCRSSSGAAFPTTSCSTLAERGTLGRPRCSSAQVRRMLADPARRDADRPTSAAQWLLVRNLATVRPGENYALNFDETLRQSMQRETELFFDSIVRENRRRHRDAHGRLHVPERAAGAALRHPERAGQPLPPRGAAGRQPAPRPARPRQHPDGDLARDPHLAGDSRQVDSEQHPRRAAARSAARRAGAVRAADAGEGADDARADGAAPEQPGVRDLPHA